jgi:hypothetical protein
VPAREKTGPALHVDVLERRKKEFVIVAFGEPQRGR